MFAPRGAFCVPGESAHTKFVGRLIRSVPRASPFGLPVCLARVPAAPLWETPIKQVASDTDALQLKP
jgi:hypothetical protein